MDTFIELPYGGPGAGFHVSKLIDHIRSTGRDYIIQGQQHCTRANHTKPQSLDVWLREGFTHRKDVAQAVNQVVKALTTTGLFEIDERLVQRRLNENEGQYLEFKSVYDRSGGLVRRHQARTVAHDVAEALCAFANADGGTLIVGVEDDKTVTGVPYPPDRLQVLIRAPETHCRPPVSAQWALVPYADVEVLAFVTDSSLEAHSLTDGRTPLRVGDATISLL